MFAPHLVCVVYRVRMLTPDHGLILEAMHRSELVEVSPSMTLIRAKGYDKWVLPPDQRNLVHNPGVSADQVHP